MDTNQTIASAVEAQEYVDKNISYKNENYNDIKFEFKKRSNLSDDNYDLYVKCQVKCNDTGELIWVQHHKVFHKNMNIRDFVNLVFKRIKEMEAHENRERFKIKDLDIFSEHLSWNKDREKIVEEVLYGDSDKVKNMIYILDPQQERGKDNIAGFYFYCPATNLKHLVYCYIDSPFTGDRYNWNEDLTKPSFSPNFVYQSEETYSEVTIKDGKLIYSDSCTHKYAGKVIDMYWMDPWGRVFKKKP